MKTFARLLMLLPVAAASVSISAFASADVASSAARHVPIVDAARPSARSVPGSGSEAAPSRARVGRHVADVPHPAPSASASTAAPNAASREVLPRLIKLQQPEAMRASPAATLETFDRQLVDGRIRFKDPMQGQASDCYFVSAMSAVAQRSPEVLRQAITELPDNKLQIRFYERTPGAEPTYRPVDVVIDRQVAALGPRHLYAHGWTAEWPALVEKAFASFRGSYDAIGNGGQTADALEALTGKPVALAQVTPSMDRATLVTSLQDAIADGRPILTGTRDRDELIEAMNDAKASGADAAAYARLLAVADPSTNADAFGAYGLVPGHSYTVLGVGHRDGEPMIVLRNPWGMFEPGAHGIGVGEVQKQGNGVFAIRADEFAMLFTHTAIGAKIP